MAQVDVIRNTYGGLGYLRNALNYVTDERALNVWGYGVNPYDVNMAYNQMLATRQYFGKVSGNPLLHIVIAYDITVQDLATAARYGDFGARFFAERFQLLYCTHEKDFEYGHFHTHIIINAVSFVDGYMIQSGPEEMRAYCDYLETMIGQKCDFEFDNKATYNR